MNCLNFFERKDKLEFDKNNVNIDFSSLIMPSEDTKISEFSQCKKSDKAPFIIYADLECILEKIDGCKNNPANSTATKSSEHIRSSLWRSTIPSFKSIDVYRSKDSMTKFSESLKEHAKKVINFKKKKRGY